MDIRLFKKLEIVGAVFVFLLAVLLHFAYELTDGSVISILFGAVNESVWENTKIFLVAYSVWAVVELLVSNVHFKPFVVGKVAGVYALCLFIIISHYLIKAFSGKTVVWVDITMGIIGIIVAQLLSYRLAVNSEASQPYFYPALVFLALFFVCIFSFTVFPPHLELFRDAETGFYGIIPKHIDRGAFMM